MAIIVVKTREQLRPDYVDPPPEERNPDGSLTRAGALNEARKLWGDLGMISSDARLPRLVWCIGRMEQTVGKGKTWEDALKHSTKRKAKLDARALEEMKREAQKEIGDYDLTH